MNGQQVRQPAVRKLTKEELDRVAGGDRNGTNNQNFNINMGDKKKLGRIDHN
jgi:hypothetical protein